LLFRSHVDVADLRAAAWAKVRAVELEPDPANVDLVARREPLHDDAFAAAKNAVLRRHQGE
jgi:hypothetical protein